MAQIRPLPGIRYAAPDLAARVTPPYDVISPEAQERYYARSPENVIRLELGREKPSDDDLDNRYTRASITFAEWRLTGILQQDAPALYLYEQQFTVQDQRYTRRSLLARVRLEPWEARVVLPHEFTLSKPKDDRLKLLRACAANLSPIMALYDDPSAELAATLAPFAAQPPPIAFTDEVGEEHRLWLLPDAALAQQVATYFESRQLYIADGHHRYETGLAYRDEISALRKELPADDATHFTLMALAAIEDPGLLVLPTHRLLRDLDAARVAQLADRLGTLFDFEHLPTDSDAATLLARLAEAGAQPDGSGTATAFVAVTRDATLLLRLRPEGRTAMAHRDGALAAASDAWRRLDLAVLHELVLAQGLDISAEQVRAGEHVSYTRDADGAIAAARTQREGTTLALLVNATPPAAIRDVATAGDRMPQKSTYFYPKLITGLVINPLW